MRGKAFSNWKCVLKMGMQKYQHFGTACEINVEDAALSDYMFYFHFVQERQFFLYALYNKNKPVSDELLRDHGSVYFRVSIRAVETRGAVTRGKLSCMFDSLIILRKMLRKLKAVVSLLLKSTTCIHSSVEYFLDNIFPGLALRD